MKLKLLAIVFTLGFAQAESLPQPSINDIASRAISIAECLDSSVPEKDVQDRLTALFTPATADYAVFIDVFNAIVAEHPNYSPKEGLRKFAARYLGFRCEAARISVTDLRAKLVDSGHHAAAELLEDEAGVPTANIVSDLQKSQSAIAQMNADLASINADVASSHPMKNAPTSSSPRHYEGWIVFGLLFLAAIAGALRKAANLNNPSA